jgi:BASS family bile acid:Na+ symporter
VLTILIVGFVVLVANGVPPSVKVGFCLIALAAGSPFSPLVTRLAKGDVATSLNLLVTLTVATMIVVPLALPPIAAAVDPQLTVATWDVAWPILAFMLLPLVIGILARVRWSDAATEAAHFFRPVLIVALLLHVNFYFVANWNAYVAAWNTGTYVAAIAVPLLGLVCAYALVTILRLKDAGTRHACEITTGMRSLPIVILMILFPFVADPLVGVSSLMANLIGLIVLLIFGLEWGRAVARKSEGASVEQTAKTEPQALSAAST